MIENLQLDYFFKNTANFNPGANLPVLIGFHGGAFIVGSGQDMGPDLLLNVADMVVVGLKAKHLLWTIHIILNIYNIHIGVVQLSVRCTGILVVANTRIFW